MPLQTTKNPYSLYSVSTGFNVNMVFFVSLQKLLFTHKPLDTSNKGVQVQSYQNLINEGFKIPQTRIITGFAEFFNLFSLDGIAPIFLTLNPGFKEGP